MAAPSADSVEADAEAGEEAATPPERGPGRADATATTIRAPAAEAGETAAEEEVAELRTSGPSPAELERPKRLERRPPPPPEPPRSLGSGDMVRDEGRW